jgi:hypothetical protein
MHVDVRLGRIERHAGTARSGGKGGMFPPGACRSVHAAASNVGRRIEGIQPRVPRTKHSHYAPCARAEGRPHTRGPSVVEPMPHSDSQLSCHVVAAGALHGSGGVADPSCLDSWLTGRYTTRTTPDRRNAG